MKKNILIISSIAFIVILLAISLFFITKQSIFNTSTEGTFYQEYPTRGIFMSESSLPLFSNEAIINTDIATFRIVVEDPIAVYRQGSKCAVYIGDYKIYRNNILIDTISSKPYRDLIMEKDFCAVPNPTQMERAYSDDGTIKGELKELPEGMNGIEIFFDKESYPSVTNKVHAVNIKTIYNYILDEEEFELKLVKLTENQIEYSLNSPGEYYVIFESHLTKIGIFPTINEIPIHLSKGENKIVISFKSKLKDVDNYNLNTKMKVYKSTSNFQGLNANSNLYLNDKRILSMEKNDYFLINDEVSFKTISSGDIEPTIDYYRFSNNECSLVNIELSKKTINDYDTLEECELNIEKESNLLNYLLIGGIIIFIGIIIFLRIRKK